MQLSPATCLSSREYTRVMELAAESWGSWRGVRGTITSGPCRDDNAAEHGSDTRRPWHVGERETGFEPATSCLEVKRLIVAPFIILSNSI